MYRLILSALFVSGFSLLAQETGNFGGVVKETPVKLENVMTNPKEFSEKTIAITGSVETVCKKKGCWMEVVDGTSKVRVTFANYGFFVPTNSEGKQVVAEGKLVEKEISEAEARHYLEDAGKSKEEIEKIKGSQKTYTFIATGVTLSDSKKK